MRAGALPGGRPHRVDGRPGDPCNPRVPRVPTSLRIALSFAAAFVGWAFGLAAYVVGEAFGTGYGQVTDFEAVALWSGLFAGAAWLSAFVPIAVRVDADGPLCRPPVAPLFGALCGLVLCALLLVPFGGLALLGQALFQVQAAMVGGVSFGLFAWSLRREGLAARPGRSTIAAAAFPPLALLAFALVLWPAFERFAPSTAYRLGTYQARQRIFERTLRTLEVGDSIEVLRERLPGEFPVETTRTTGNAGPHLSYTIELEDGRVTRVELRERP